MESGKTYMLFSHIPCDCLAGLKCAAVLNQLYKVFKFITRSKEEIIAHSGRSICRLFIIFIQTYTK